MAQPTWNLTTGVLASSTPLSRQTWRQQRPTGSLRPGPRTASFLHAACRNRSSQSTRQHGRKTESVHRPILRLQDGIVAKLNLPGIIVSCSCWHLYLFRDTPDAVVMYKAVGLGDTHSLLGIYQLPASLRTLTTWAKGPFWTWFKKDVPVDRPNWCPKPAPFEAFPRSIPVQSKYSTLILSLFVFAEDSDTAESLHRR